MTPTPSQMIPLNSKTTFITHSPLYSSTKPPYSSTSPLPFLCQMGPSFHPSGYISFKTYSFNLTFFFLISFSCFFLISFSVFNLFIFFSDLSLRSGVSSSFIAHESVTLARSPPQGFSVFEFKIKITYYSCLDVVTQCFSSMYNIFYATPPPRKTELTR